MASNERKDTPPIVEHADAGSGSVPGQVAEEEAIDDTPSEDPIPQILSGCSVGTAAVAIHQCEVDWQRDNPEGEPNRPLDNEHVKRVAENMKSQLSWPIRPAGYASV